MHNQLKGESVHVADEESPLITHVFTFYTPIQIWVLLLYSVLMGRPSLRLTQTQDCIWVDLGSSFLPS